MRLVGTVTERNDVTATIPQLTAQGMIQPEIMRNVLPLFEANYATVSSLLVRRGSTPMNVGGLQNTDSFKTIGSRQVKWSVEGYPTRKAVIREAPSSGTPGALQEEFSFVTDIDWFGVGDDLELGDRRTTIHVNAKTRVGNGARYFCKLNTNRIGDFVDPTLLAVDAEVGWLHTSFPELSEDATEKTVFPEWYTTFIGIQRAKYTISGSAMHSKIYFEHNGVRLWDTRQNFEMLRRWAMGIENQMLFGRSTMDSQGNCLVQDRLGRDIVMGDGLIAQGDNSLKYTYNTLSHRHLDAVLQDLQAMATTNGTMEVMAICGSQFFFEFQALMRDVFGQAPQVLFAKGSGDSGNGVETNFTSYRVGNVKLTVAQHQALDNPTRPIIRDNFGRNINSRTCYFVSLGNTVGGDPNIQPLALGNERGDRSFVRRVISGMAGPGYKTGDGKYEVTAASPVDGMQVHVLNEVGIMLRNPFGFAELRAARRV